VLPATNCKPAQPYTKWSGQFFEDRSSSPYCPYLTLGKTIQIFDQATGQYSVLQEFQGKATDGKALEFCPNPDDYCKLGGGVYNSATGQFCMQDISEDLEYGTEFNGKMVSQQGSLHVEGTYATTNGVTGLFKFQCEKAF